ncbi:MAG: T9SS type B sorting domain-containing protein, partial [Bacteroidales bacterium]
GNDFALDNISLRKLCKAIDTVNITIYDAAIIPKDIYITICENDFPYQYFDSVFYQAGIYGYVFSTNSETDSLHIVNISTNPKYTTTIFDTICEGETYTQNGFNVYTQGQHTQNLQTIQGCDSIINLNLYVENIEDTIIDAVICNGEVYTNYGFNQHREGTYYGYYLFSGKCNTRIILNLSVINSVEMLLFPQEDMMVEQYPITLDATCTGCDSYIWSSGQSSPTINVYSKGMYKVCAFSDCGYICDSVVINNPDVYVFLPNSFTPSNSSNTVFEIYTQKEKVELVVFEIFDRWGEKIFETKDIYEGWDGTFKGKLCNSDVFAYKVLYKTRYTQDQVFEKTGLVSLIR